MSESPRGGPALGRKQRLLLRVERFSREHYRLVFLMALLAVVAGVVMSSRLELESDILKLIPAGNRQVDAFKSAVREFGSIDYLIVVLDAGKKAGPDDLEDFADLYAERLRSLDEDIEDVEYRFRLDADFLELFYRNALLFLPPSEIPELAQKLSTGAIDRKLREDRLMLASPASPVAEQMLRYDPLGLMPLFLNRLAGSRGAFKIDLSDGYYLSRDNTKLIMLVKPTKPSQDLDFDRRLLDEARSAAAAVREELAGDDESASPVTVRFGGNYAMALEESDLIRADVKRNLWVSLLAVSALYWLCYRRFAALLYSSIPLLVGQALTAVLAFLVLHRLNAATSSFTALLMGLGTDFTIVMYARYIEERRRGLDLAAATEAMVGETGLGVFTGAITSAGTFYAMCISRFRGLFDLGFLIGSGILLCGVAIVFMLPAMIKWNEGVRRRKVDSIRKLHLQSFGLERLIPFSVRHRRAVLVATAIATVAGGWLATRLDFDDSINALRSNRTEASVVQHELAQTFDASLSYMMAIAEADTRAEAIALTAEIQERLRPFLADGTIGSYDSILTYLPPLAEQEAVIRAVRDRKDDAFDPERIRRDFIRGLRENGFREDAFGGYLARMERFLRPERPITLDDLVRQGLGRLVERYVRESGGKVRVVTYLFTRDPRWKRTPPPGLVQALSDGDPGIVVTGTNVVGRELRRFFSREAPRAVVVGLVLVFVLLLVDFRSLKLTSIAMLQLVCGVLMMLGAMRVLGIELNYVNAFVATMILGVGIDYSIHLVHRMHGHRGRVEPGLLETGKAVVMAALTNIAGFGTLVLGSYPALRSFGLVACIGSLTCLVTALTLVPAMMGRDDGRRADERGADA